MIKIGDNPVILPNISKIYLGIDQIYGVPPQYEILDYAATDLVPVRRIADGALGSYDLYTDDFLIRDSDVK